MRLIVVTILLQLFSSAIQAQRLELDDSLSPQHSFGVDMSLSSGELRAMIVALINGDDTQQTKKTGNIPDVDVRLDTSAYIGKNAKIYLTLQTPTNVFVSPDSMLLSWQTSGVFSNGQVRPGQSTLVFQGMIQQPVSGDVFNFILEFGANNALPPSFRFEPKYEIELIY